EPPEQEPEESQPEHGADDDVPWGGHRLFREPVSSPDGQDHRLCSERQEHCDQCAEDRDAEPDPELRPWMFRLAVRGRRPDALPEEADRAAEDRRSDTRDA